MAGRLDIIIPAHDEAALIGDCLLALLRSEGPADGRVIVVANGCTDDTAARADAFGPQFADKGWNFKVIELARGHKPGALNAGDAAAAGSEALIYLDADVIVTPALTGQICALLDRPEPAYASGRVQIAPARSAVSRAYARIYAQVPFMTTGVPGCGLFAVNRAGRARWGDWPDIIADDTFARLHFAPDERHLAQASYLWPVVEGGRALLRVRRRQNAGVREIAAKYPHLAVNDDKPAFGLGRAARLALRDPVGFAVYAGLGLLARRGGAHGWSRGR